MAATLSRRERLSGTVAVAELFNRGKSGAEGCIRYKYIFRDDEAPTRIVVSVPKRSFKRAVKRNLLKRRLREAYRLQKQLLTAGGVDLLLSYSHPEIADFQTIYAEVTDILQRISLRLSGREPDPHSAAQ